MNHYETDFNREDKSGGKKMLPCLFEGDAIRQFGVDAWKISTERCDVRVLCTLVLPSKYISFPYKDVCGLVFYYFFPPKGIIFVLQLFILFSQKRKNT